jgi:hypothetical protein
MQRILRKFMAARSTTEREADQPPVEGVSIRCLTCGEMNGCEQWFQNVEANYTPPPLCRNASLIVDLQAIKGQRS